MAGLVGVDSTLESSWQIEDDSEGLTGDQETMIDLLAVNHTRVTQPVSAAKRLTLTAVAV